MKSLLHEHAVEQPSGTVRVMPGMWRKGQQSDVLYTRGIGACIGVAIYDTAARVGYMAHVFSTLGSQQETLEPMLESVDSRAARSSDLRAWVVGGSSEADDQPYQPTTGPLRSNLISHLGELGLDPSSLDISWNNDQSLLVTTFLDCAQGELTAVEQPIIK